MRYRLRTLLILLAVGPVVLAGIHEFLSRQSVLSKRRAIQQARVEQHGLSGMILWPPELRLLSDRLKTPRPRSRRRITRKLPGADHVSIHDSRNGAVNSGGGNGRVVVGGSAAGGGWHWRVASAAEEGHVAWIADRSNATFWGTAAPLRGSAETRHDSLSADWR
jgi:hypothetical protein